MANWIKAIYFVVILAWVIYVLSDDAVKYKSFPRRFGLSVALTVIIGLAGFALWHAAVPTSIKLLSEDSEVAESHSLASLKTGSHLDGKAALSFGYLTEQDEYVVMMRQDDGGYRRKSYPADGTVVYEDAEADDARVEVVDQYVVIRETHEFPIVGEWTRDRRKFLKCEIRIHVPAGSIAQGDQAHQGEVKPRPARGVLVAQEPYTDALDEQLLRVDRGRCIARAGEEIHRETEGGLADGTREPWRL